MAEKKYWKGLEELHGDPEFLEKAQREFPGEIPADFFDEKNDGLYSNRRDFLKMMGFSLTAATIAAGCEIPVRKVAPYIFKPEDVMPGVATWYASSYINGGDYCSILVKTREGRPIKIEGNRDSVITRGGTNARAQASVLSLYDGMRISGPKQNFQQVQKDATWGETDLAVIEKLTANPNAAIRFLSSTIISPSTKKVFDKFKAKYPNTRFITYDAVSSSGLLMANQATEGKCAIPHYDFAKAKTIVGIDCDFLGTWISPVEYIKDYVQGRKLGKKEPSMNRHFQIESRMSMTGANADYRIGVMPSEIGVAALMLLDKVSGTSYASGMQLSVVDRARQIDAAAASLKKNAGASLVVCGSNNMYIQVIVNAINRALGNIGKTISFDMPCMLRGGMDKDLKDLVSEMEHGDVEILMVNNCNPVYDSPLGDAFAKAMDKVPMSISFAGSLDETSKLCKYLCPDHHYLESWNDAEPRKGCYSLAQPTIRHLFDTRQMQDSLLTWCATGGETAQNYADFLMQNWSDMFFSGSADKEHDFHSALQVGVYQPMMSQGMMDADMTGEMTGAMEPGQMPMAPAMGGGDMTANAAAEIAKEAKSAQGLQVQFYEKVSMGDGRYANNPWLQELPDPVSKITWDNYINVSPEWARVNGLIHGDVITLTLNGKDITLPISVQPGQVNGSMSVAMGYGRTVIGRVGEEVGKNVAPLIDASGDCFQYTVYGGSFKPQGDNIRLAQTQTHFNLNDGVTVREIVKETTLGEYQHNHLAGNEDHAEKSGTRGVTFYPDYMGGKNGFNWGMAIDLNSCVGCGACVIACNSENNVPVVGRTEVRRAHEMHWMRIDRYYSGDPENPEVVFQPMLCQHCENAPCENVCPVSATNHSSEGFNQMIYNRCIGTRYCANNCPYKVRRFNWFDYAGTDTFGKFNDPVPVVKLGMMEDLTRMVLNPDVTVRSRGVMEKCSFCVQRIQEAKLQAKKEDRQLRDGDIRTACQSSCPADAIVFGNLYDDTSTVSLQHADERAYGVLEEEHWVPSVMYLTKVRNKEKADHENGIRLDIMDLYNYK